MTWRHFLLAALLLGAGVAVARLPAAPPSPCKWYYFAHSEGRYYYQVECTKPVLPLPDSSHAP